VPAETTDRLLILASDGRFFTLGCDKLPSGRSQGEPLRLMLDFDDKVQIVSIFPHKPGRKRVLASTGGYGFLMLEDDALANRRAGKSVLNVDDGAALICLEAEGDHLAVIGDNGKIVIFPLAELPEMTRGKGVKLQSYREGGLRDAMTFDAEVGPAWTDAAGRKREWKDWRDWLGRRATSGKIAPKGFAASKRFRPK
jgi:topoisomerase-4 subunit A